MGEVYCCARFTLRLLSTAVKKPSSSLIYVLFLIKFASFTLAVFVIFCSATNTLISRLFSLFKFRFSDFQLQFLFKFKTALSNEADAVCTCECQALRVYLEVL